MEKRANAERNWSTSAYKTEFSDSSTKLNESVNELGNELDENENEVKRNCVYMANGNATSCPTDYSIASLVPKMKNLQLSQQEKEPEHLAGYVKAVIPPSGTMVIQHAPGSKILDVGTAIFMQKINDNVKNYEEIGFVSDIFGSINEPMYALQLQQKFASDFLKLDSQVFYFHNHSTARFINVECDGNDHYTVTYS